jgi:hypothetical protein
LNRLHQIYWIGKGVGWDNVPRRLYQAFANRSGLLRRTLDPKQFELPLGILPDEDDVAWMNRWKERRAKFFPLPSQQQLRSCVSESRWEESVTSVCLSALSGKYPYFSHWTGDIGWPPDFQRDPVHDLDWPVGEHWIHTARSGPPRNDIKLVWEASRLTLAYHLVRQYRYTMEDRWAEEFWKLVEAWQEQNPANLTVAWGCGQETAFRMMAILFGVMSVIESAATTPSRLKRIQGLMWQFGKRIRANINYAISQENNHALSEATGLWTLGILFPEFPESSEWRDYGKSILEKEVKRQIYSDGSYVQHSMSYHRVMMDDMIWAVALGRINGIEFSSPTLEKMQASTNWLAEFVDWENGRVPNLGANDGANVLPLSCCDYLDYRPVITTAAELFGTTSGFGKGEWSEKCLWLLGASPVNPRTNSNEVSVPNRSALWSAPQGGYHILRGSSSHAMIRAGNFKDRPSQCDMLHVDLWHNHRNVLRDSGSYRYYDKDSEVKKYFYSVAAHNTVQVNTDEQMIKGPNFLWFKWPKSTVTIPGSNSIKCRSRIAAASNYVHERELLRSGDCYEVHDCVFFQRVPLTPPTIVARWHLDPEINWLVQEPNVYLGQLHGEDLCRLSFQSKDNILVQLSNAWESLYYGSKREVPVLVVSFGEQPLITKFEPLQ